VTAACAPGFKVHGLGGDITGGAGQVTMDDLPRQTSLDSVTVTGVEDENGTAANWSLRAYAICAQ
jgi:hypothetical protein